MGEVVDLDVVSCGCEVGIINFCGKAFIRE